MSLSTILSNYSLNMACALRQYAETGDLPHILRRMIHLLAMQSDDGDKSVPYLFTFTAHSFILNIIEART